jgi:hypothetical protein
VSGTLAEFPWDIRDEGRSWRGSEALARWEMTPEKFEMIEGKPLWDAESRETLLCLLLENVGVDRVVRFGKPDVWRAAIAKLDK